MTDRPNSTVATTNMMTRTGDDGWPDKYSDPRDRPHPSVLHVTVESFDELREDTIDSAGGISKGEEHPAVVSFETVAKLWEVLCHPRVELLQTLAAVEGAAESIAALAETLDRDYPEIRADVSLLADHGLLFTIKDGQAERPFLPYYRIRLDVELTG